MQHFNVEGLKQYRTEELEKDWREVPINVFLRHHFHQQIYAKNGK